MPFPTRNSIFQLPAIYNANEDEILLLVLLICNCTKEPFLKMDMEIFAFCLVDLCSFHSGLETGFFSCIFIL